MGVTPGLPLSPFSSLAPAMPGTPGNPWEQPSPPQLPWRKTHVEFTSTRKTKTKTARRQQRALLTIQCCPIVPNTTAGTWIYLVGAFGGVLRKLVRSSGVLRKTKSYSIKVRITLIPIIIHCEACRLGSFLWQDQKIITAQITVWSFEKQKKKKKNLWEISHNLVYQPHCSYFWMPKCKHSFLPIINSYWQKKTNKKLNSNEDLLLSYSSFFFKR